MSIGERIRYIRNLRGMTQKELGKAIGFDDRTADIRIAQYESGTRTPKANYVEAIAKALNVKTYALNVPETDTYLGLIHTLFALEDTDDLRLFLDREIGIRPVRIVIQCDLLEKFPDRFLIGLNAAVNFDRIEERAFQLDHLKVFRICNSLITDPVFDADDESSELLNIENADMIVGTEGTLVFADLLRNNALAEISDLFR